MSKILTRSPSSSIKRKNNLYYTNYNRGEIVLLHCLCTDKRKENFPHIVCKSYMTKCLLESLWLNICAFPHILESPRSTMNFIFFFNSAGFSMNFLNSQLLNSYMIVKLPHFDQNHYRIRICTSFLPV
jgi:hypothetical protein